MVWQPSLHGPVRYRADADLIPEASDAEAKKHFLEAKEIVVSQQVADFLKEHGMTTDDLVAMILKQTGAAQ